jgi:hypothetical protein
MVYNKTISTTKKEGNMGKLIMNNKGKEQVKVLDQLAKKRIIIKAAVSILNRTDK